MNEIQAERMAEDAAMGSALMQCLADIYCCEPTEAAVKRGVYKNTECGAWIAFTATGVKVGSIVEGSDAETQSFDVPYNGDDEAFRKAFFEALNEIEAQADLLWHEANAEGGAE